MLVEKILIGGVGYHNLRDLSLGPVLTRRLAAMHWPDGVEVDADLSFGPIAIVQRFQAMDEAYQRVVLFAAVRRGRDEGSVRVYRWQGYEHNTDEIQARIGEAVTGVVSLDNLLVIGEHFGIWPQELIVVEVEPQDETWGEGFSQPVQSALEKAIELIRDAALNGVSATETPGGSPARQEKESGR